MFHVRNNLLGTQAHYKDKKDLDKLGVIPQIDTLIKFLFLLAIRFVLGDDQDQTHIRTFTNSKRQIFEDGAIDGFVMSVPRCLDPLNYFHIWHDNSGKGSSAS
jgi:hypothetical protein